MALKLDDKSKYIQKKKVWRRKSIIYNIIRVNRGSVVECGQSYII